MIDQVHTVINLLNIIWGLEDMEIWDAWIFFPHSFIGVESLLGLLDVIGSSPLLEV